MRAFLVPRLLVGFRIVEVPTNHGRPTNTQVAAYIEVGDVCTIIVDQPKGRISKAHKLLSE